MIKDLKEIYKEMADSAGIKLAIEEGGIYGGLTSKFCDNSFNFDNLYFSTDLVPIGSPILKGETTIYAGRSILTNNSNIDQKLKTDSYVHEESFITTIKNTNGYNLGIQTSAKFKLDLEIAEVETAVTIDTKFSYSTEESQSSTVKKTITIPSQELVVPAKSALEVVAYFTKGTAEGDLIANAILEGTDTLNIICHKPGKITETFVKQMGLGDIEKYSSYKDADIKGDSSNPNRLVAKAKQRFSCEAANQFRIAITEVKNNRRVGETKIIDVTPIITEI